ncbi:hypothetical protein K378_04744 [Streptomyces sp. Amel2xB2]|uniref:hypothetical protein n=1 Tax=Streptomyces sp. Amel2xB2 TaxID=1305829 RepID=UPI000DC027FF|nr:hypothetical protein [Streptomyces sp. Amel2xB2]RAJ60046.1 hypothetical protein K378_04744 [Streptomyces sp. Amel2xB2]
MTELELELPHTRTRMVHWMGTAVALAAVVGLSSFVQPAGATAQPTLTTAASGTAPAPDAKKADYPVDCGSPSVKVDVVAKGSADFDGDGQQETVASVRCHSGTGTPPNALFVLGAAPRPDQKPRVVATMLRMKERMTVEDLKVDDRTVSAKLLGYSSPSVPSCCPDRQRKVKWEWKDGKFALEAAPVPGGSESI